MSTPYYQDDKVRLFHGDCLEVMRTLPDSSVDSVVCDPPYGLSNTDPAHVADTIVRWVNGERDYLPPAKGGFMGAAWDSFVPPVAVWDECYRVLKPGGHVLAFAGSRTHDLMTLGIRLAGFDVRDSIAWLTGSGFPKSLDVSKAIDKAAGAEREVIGVRTFADGTTARATAGSAGIPGSGASGQAQITTPATPNAEQWQGWGSALKPGHEPCVVARKPFQGTLAANVLAHGTGALNIAATRVAATDKAKFPAGVVSDTEDIYGNGAGRYADRPRGEDPSPAGRWPANVVLDEEMARRLDEQSGESVSSDRPRRNTAEAHNRTASMGKSSEDWVTGGHSDSGGASRFFYVAKAGQSERPRYTRPKLRLRGDLTPEQVDHVRARLTEAGVQVD